MNQKFKLFTVILFVLLIISGCGSKYKYDTAQNDPLNTRIYTLDNGLKVYMCVNKETPRIQTYIAVKTGSKNDPHETTGLAHYFEHLMFKGTEQFGTQDFSQEKPMLDQIEQLFEVYRVTTDSSERAAIYHQIDSISYEASKLAIPNEYDKLMSAIGATGTNAWTSFDETVYTEEIPSNQIDNWAKIQSDRFANMTIRGFHTELETIYEEYNMSLTDDWRKANEEMLKSLYPNHPYGQQTTLGTSDNLKNPSITNVKNYKKDYYVPNNMAICLSGDFDPDSMIVTIDKYFGKMIANDSIPQLSYKQEEPITQPIVKEIVGLESEFVTMTWRAGGARTKDAILIDLIGSILSNSKAGLIDVDIMQPQKVLDASAYGYCLADYGVVEINGIPKEGQSLEEVKDLLLAEVAKLRSGDFNESLLQATLANYKLNRQRRLDSNSGRAVSYVRCFINGVSWQDYINELDVMSKITKQDIVDYANNNLKDNNYVIIYKRQGNPSIEKINKPAITPIVTNRDKESQFLTDVKNYKPADIQPVFLDFEKDMSVLTAKNNIPVLYKKNETTDLFRLIYLFEEGKNNNSALSVAFDYFSYLGTDEKSLEEINNDFYNIACDFRLNCTDNRSTITISGLSENMPKAMELIENLLAQAVPNEEALANLKSDIIKQRADNKLDQRSNYRALLKYATYGQDYITKTTLSNDRVMSLSSEELLGYIHDLTNLEHRILYYGPLSQDEAVAQINKYHNTPEQLTPSPEKVVYTALQTPENSVLLAQYDAKQIYFSQIYNNGEKFNSEKAPIIRLYNEYFGGGMNAIVFQEMREARGLAYSAQAYLASPNNLDETYSYSAFIATQNDKMTTAMEAFEDIINNMPESESAFDIAKTNIIANLETKRSIKENVLWQYINCKDLGLDYDLGKYTYDEVKKLTLNDIVKFQQENIKNKTYTYCILGDIKELDMNKLESIAPVKILKQEEIFGY